MAIPAPTRSVLGPGRPASARSGRVRATAACTTSGSWRTTVKEGHAEARCPSVRRTIKAEGASASTKGRCSIRRRVAEVDARGGRCGVSGRARLPQPLALPSWPCVGTECLTPMRSVTTAASVSAATTLGCRVRWRHTARGRACAMRLGYRAAACVRFATPTPTAVLPGAFVASPWAVMAAPPTARPKGQSAARGSRGSRTARKSDPGRVAK